MTLVQAPVALDGDPVAVSGIESQVGGVDGAALQGGVDDIGEDAAFLQQFATAGGFGATLLGQGNVYPAGEEVLFVPF